jgi:hypothetical protein
VQWTMVAAACQRSSSGGRWLGARDGGGGGPRPWSSMTAMAQEVEGGSGEPTMMAQG